MKQLPSPRSIVCWLVGSLFLVSTFLLGKLNTNLVYSDILLPLLLLTLVFVVRPDLENTLLLPIALLLTYALISAISHLYFNRLEIFFLVCYFCPQCRGVYCDVVFSSIAKKYDQKFLLILVTIVAIAVQNTLIQYLSGVRAYYGYARIGANFAPANTGFLIGSLTVGLCGLFMLMVNRISNWTGKLIGLGALLSFLLL